MKYLLVLVVVVGAIWMLLKRSRQDADERAPLKGGKTPAPPPAVAEMVACQHCRVHLPRSEAVADPQGRVFCSPAHRDAGPR